MIEIKVNPKDVLMITQHAMDLKTMMAIERNNDHYGRFYHFRDKNQIPRITVCLLTDKETGRISARGVAVCSRFDSCIPSTGKLLAMRKAYRALNGKQDGWFVGNESREIIEEARCNFRKHGYANLKMTDAERVLVDHI